MATLFLLYHSQLYRDPPSHALAMFASASCSAGRCPLPTAPATRPAFAFHASAYTGTSGNLYRRILLSTEARSRQTLVRPRSAAQADAGTNEEPVALAWHQRPCKWETVSSAEDLEKAIANSEGKFTAIDFFAG